MQEKNKKSATVMAADLFLAKNDFILLVGLLFFLKKIHSLLRI